MSTLVAESNMPTLEVNKHEEFLMCQTLKEEGELLASDPTFEPKNESISMDNILSGNDLRSSLVETEVARIQTDLPEKEAPPKTLIAELETLKPDDI